MAIKDRFTKALAIFGTVFVCIPVLLPIFFWVFSAKNSHPYNFDFILPAEFSPLAILGGGLLLWAVQHTGVASYFSAHRRLIGETILIAFVSLVASQVLAVTTGLADGSRDLSGFPWLLVVTFLAIYTLTLLALVTGGILLIADLFQDHKPGNQPHIPVT